MPHTYFFCERNHHKADCGPTFKLHCNNLQRQIRPSYDSLSRQQKKKKGKEEYLYSAFIQRLVSMHSDMDHSVTCKLHHACLSYVSIHQMAPPLNVVANI